jgi:drug/metabolite transporter (DMT)-like permease
MLAGMAGFALEDAIIKHIAGSLSVAQILLLLGGGGWLAFGILGRRQGAPFFTRDFFAAPVLVRFCGELVGSIGMTMALALVALSLTSAIIQALPILTTLGAVLVYRETVGWRRWAAIAMGFAGVLIVLRPWSASFEPEALFAVLAVVGMSIRDLATRRVPGRVHTLQLASWGFGSLVPASLLLFAWGMPWHPVTPATVGLLATCLCLGMTSYYAIITAMRIADMGVIAPFRYTRMVFGLALGVLVFGETPDTWVYVGATLIVSAGLYTFWREHHLRRRAAAAAAPGPAA